jgi:hypothetical protein
MATKLETFLTEKKIDRRRVVAASHQLEKLRREDRAIKLANQQARKKDEKRAADAPKPRSGKPVALSTLQKALAGQAVSGPTKTRLLRAVNHILEQRKQGTVALGDLFEAPKKA